MMLDGRNGAYGMTFNRVATNPVSMPANLLSEAKTALYINDESFNDKISLLCFDAIYEFERITSTSILPQTVTVNYEYFKGKNKLPFGPQNGLTDLFIYGTDTLITDYTVTGNSLEYTGSESVKIVFTAGYNTTLPANIRRTLVKMAECMFRDEAYKPSLYNEIRSYSQWMH